MKTLREQLTFTQANIQVLEESGADGLGKNLYLKGICIEGNKRNANDRIYPLHEISKAVNTINQQIKEGNSVKPVHAGGEMGGRHDTAAYSNSTKDLIGRVGNTPAQGTQRPSAATKPSLGQAAGVNTKSPVARG